MDGRWHQRCDDPDPDDRPTEYTDDYPGDYTDEWCSEEDADADDRPFWYETGRIERGRHIVAFQPETALKMLDEIDALRQQVATLSETST